MKAIDWLHLILIFLVDIKLPGWLNEGKDLSEKELQRKECRRKSEENRNSKKKQIQVPAGFLKICQILL